MKEPHIDVGLFWLKNGLETQLELEAQAELHDARVVRLV